MTKEISQRPHLDAKEALKKEDLQKRYVFSRDELRLLFGTVGFKESLQALLLNGTLVRVARGVYVNIRATSRNAYLLGSPQKTEKIVR